MVGRSPRKALRRWLKLAPLVAIALVLLVPSPAAAQSYAEIYVSPQNAQPGQSVALIGTGFSGAVGSATIEWTDGTVIGSAPIDSHGNWIYTFVLPQGVDSSWRLTALAYDGSGQPIQNAPDPIAVTGPGAPAPPLVRTTSTPPTPVTTPTSTAPPLVLPNRAPTAASPSSQTSGSGGSARPGTGNQSPSVDGGAPLAATRHRGTSAPDPAPPAGGRSGHASAATPASAAPAAAGTSQLPTADAGQAQVGTTAATPSSAHHNPHRNPPWQTIVGVLVVALLCIAGGVIAWLMRTGRIGWLLAEGFDPIEAELQALLANAARHKTPSGPDPI